MKKSIFTFLVAVSALFSGTVTAQSELQVIHNCADPAANSVDIYVNGALTLDDFMFREATPFLNLPSNTDIEVGVAPGSSVSANDTLVNFTINLMPGERYVAIASGVLDPSSFASNPDGIATGFGLQVLSGIQTDSQLPANVDLVINHGSTDAPTVDVLARGVATLLDNAAYSDFSSYIPVPAGSYILDITPGNDNSTIVASFEADLSSLAGSAAVVFASGFLDPMMNQNGESFGLFAALPSGTVVPLPATSVASLQVIHNSADPAAATVDIYLDGTLAIDDFGFRDATPFIDVPGGVNVNIGIAPPNSTSVNDTIANIVAQFSNGETYVAIASGVLDPAAFASNPDGLSTAFELQVTAGVQTEGTDPLNVDFIVNHGSTDAPTVDVIARNVATLVDDAAYGDFTSYISVPAASYILDITPGSNNSTIVASFEADLSGLGGGSAVVFASGFLDPTMNQNGEAFGLFAALANGTVVQLPKTSLARLQVIHNAADPAASLVDIYVNGSLTLDDFGFRTATPFIDIPGDVPVNIGVAPSASTGVNDTLVNFTVQFDNGQTYAAIANGVLNPASFAANPDGIATGFTLFLQNNVQEEAQQAGDVDFIVVHGATDAPTVDVVVSFGGPTLVDDAAYSDITPYLNVPAAVYSLDVTPGNNNSVIVASYTADLSGLGGGSAVVFASGFLDPSLNQNGAAFGLYAALANGTVVPFQVTTSLNDINGKSNVSIYPNPVSVNGMLNIVNPENEEMEVTITGMDGKLYASYRFETGIANAELQLENIASGMYLVTSRTPMGASVQKLLVK